MGGIVVSVVGALGDRVVGGSASIGALHSNRMYKMI